MSTPAGPTSIHLTPEVSVTVTRKQARPGDKIANGATVIAVRCLPHIDLFYAVLLCTWNGEYVTWIGDYDGQGTALGHYHGSDWEEAVEDFNERSKRS